MPKKYKEVIFKVIFLPTASSPCSYLFGNKIRTKAPPIVTERSLFHTVLFLCIRYFNEMPRGKKMQLLQTISREAGGGRIILFQHYAALRKHFCNVKLVCFHGFLNFRIKCQCVLLLPKHNDVQNR